MASQHAPKTHVGRVGDFPSGRREHGAKVFIVTLIPECTSASMIAREEDGESQAYYGLTGQLDEARRELPDDGSGPFL